jgi:hypothetical protein
MITVFQFSPRGRKEAFSPRQERKENKYILQHFPALPAFLE